MRKKYRMNFQIYFKKGDDADCGVVFFIGGNRFIFQICFFYN